MRINPIGLGYSNLRQNKVEKNSSKVMSNPVEDSDNFAKVSPEQLQGMNNISFKSNGPNQDEIEAILNSPLLKKDENGQTFFHKASAEDIKARRQEITPLLLKTALPMQDNKGNTCLHYPKRSEFVNTIADILDDEAPEALSEALALQNNDQDTFLHNYQYPETLEIYRKTLGDKASEIFANACLAKDNEGEIPIHELIRYRNGIQQRFDESKIVFKALGNKTAEVVRNFRDEFGRTVFHYPLKPEAAQILVDNMGDDEAQQVLYEMLSMQDNNKNTFLHTKQYPETLEIYAKALKDKAPEVFANACLAKDNEYTIPIYGLIRYYDEQQPRLDESKVVFKAFGDKTAEVVRNFRDEFSGTIFNYPLKPEVAQIIVDNMGDDEAQQVLYEMLPMQDDNKKTFLHYYQYPETLEIYAKALKDKAPEVFAKAYTSKIIMKKPPQTS